MQLQEVYVPTQELQDLLFSLCTARIDTYEMQPEKGVVYPFCYMGEQYEVDEQVVKRTIWPRIVTTIHFYDVAERKASMRALITQLKSDVRRHDKTPHYYLSVKAANVQILNERDGNRELVHGVLELDIQVH